MKVEEIYEIFQNYSVICTDTRKITENCLFFALKGEHFNGNEFASDAIEQGAKYAIIDEVEYETKSTILVKDVLSTLQELANYHRNYFDIPFIGITGTNGKTTSKELINAVLSQHYKTEYTKGNFNNHIGVPLTVLSIKTDCELAIVEMGANHIGEIDFLCKIAEPNYGIITNIGTAHIEGFGSKEEVIKTKNEMYEFIAKHGKLIFTNNDDHLLRELSASISKYTYGKSEADCTASIISETPHVKLMWNNLEINSNLYGAYNFYNILLAICVGQYFKVPDDKIKVGIENYISENNRSQFIKTRLHQIYLDAYNANPSSMNVAIDSFATNSNANKLMILGDMLELGEISKAEHQAIVNKANELSIKTYFVGKEFSNVQNKYSFNYFSNTKELLDFLKKNELSNESILIKGSRGIKLEEIASYIQKKEQ